MDNCDFVLGGKAFFISEIIVKVSWGKTVCCSIYKQLTYVVRSSSPQLY